MLSHYLRTIFSYCFSSRILIIHFGNKLLHQLVHIGRNKPRIIFGVDAEIFTKLVHYLVILDFPSSYYALYLPYFFVQMHG
jgi:hypothetical protein